MKVWINEKSGRVAGYAHDFPDGAPGLILADAPEGFGKKEAAKTAVPVIETAVEGDDERESLVAQYTQKFGKAPHANTKIETLKERLSEA